MPSSNKTSNLSLNNWLGTDKPKKDDFNTDNASIDKAYGTLSTSIAAVSTAQQNAKNATDTELSALNTRCDTINSSISSHVANAVAHITAAERTTWNNAGTKMVVGTYTGTGTATVKVTMGFQPQFGVLFAVGSGTVEASYTTEQTYVYSAFFSSSGCSRNVALESDGLTLTHSTTASSSGSTYCYNTSGKTYVYVAWKP